MSGAEERLLAAIRQNRAPHAILITGPAGSDTLNPARRAAAQHCLGAADAALLENCPDYQELGADGIGVDDIRAMQKALTPRPFGTGRAIVFHDAHRMTEAAQNALLKTLEEPPQNTMLLLSGSENGLLYTIRSRCGIIRLGALPEQEIIAQLRMLGADADAAAIAARLSGGGLSLARQMASPAFQAFFPLAVRLYAQTLESNMPPYAQTAALLNTQAMPEGEKPKSKTEERRASGIACLHIWQHLAKEQLHALLGLEDNPPWERPPLRRRFTIKEIQGIMELILSAERRIGVANPQLTMDALVTQLSVPADKRKDN